MSLAQERSWRVCIIATPSALEFVDKAALEEQTGFPARHQYKKPGAAYALPMADAIIVGGASFNNFNKWALGISDTLALGLMTEGIGQGIWIVALPFFERSSGSTPGLRAKRRCSAVIWYCRTTWCRRLQTACATSRLEKSAQASLAGGAGCSRRGAHVACLSEAAS